MPVSGSLTLNTLFKVSQAVPHRIHFFIQTGQSVRDDLILIAT